MINLPNFAAGFSFLGRKLTLQRLFGHGGNWGQKRLWDKLSAAGHACGTRKSAYHPKIRKG
jgi:hypothetical protein